MALGTRVRCRPVAAALLACASLALGSAQGASGVSLRAAGQTPAVRLLHQTPVVRASGQLLGLSLTRTGPAAAPGATVTLTLYARLTTRSGLLAAIGAAGPSMGVSATPPVPASCLAHRTQLHIAVTIAEDGAAVPPRQLCGEDAPVLRLGCTAYCGGVYPLRVTVHGAGSSATFVTLVTFATRSTTPLRVAWVLRVAGKNDQLPGSTGALRAAVAHPAVPLTVDVEGGTLATALSTPGATTAVSLLSQATSVPAHQLMAEAYVPADLGGLHASGLRDEVTRQFALTAVSLANVGVGAAPVPTATFGTGPQTPTSADAVGTAHLVARTAIRDLLIEGATLSVDPATTQSWGAAFKVSGAAACPTALATDTELEQLSAQTAADPALAAAQFLGELAFLHFEQPDLAQPRAVAVVTTATTTVTTAFVDAVLAGLTSNPVLRPVTTTSAFAAVPIGANGFPPQRAMALGPSSPFPSITVSQLRGARAETDALSSAVVAGVTPIPSIEGELLSAEQVLSTALRTAILGDVHYRIQQELGNFHIDNGSITLTESGALLPITVLSTAPFTVSGTLRLTSSQLAFPSGSTQPVLMPASVLAVRIAARALTSGDLHLYATLVSPHGGLVLAHADIIVRATPTSIVGIALTVGAILVLALWWVRTSRRRRAAAR